MVTHYYDSFNEYGNLCNTKTQSKPTKDKVSFKKCQYILTSEELLSSFNKNKGDILAKDIRNSKNLFRD